MAEPKSITRLTMLFAMEAEARGIIEFFDASESKLLHPALPARVWSVRSGAIELTICVHGKDPLHKIDRIGTETAALTSWLLMENCSPELLINAGTCGGFESQGRSIGQVLLGEGHAWYHDHRVALPGFCDLGEARVPLAPFSYLQSQLGLSGGPISSGSSIDSLESELAVFRKRAIAIKDMEATAIAEVARDRGVPFLAVKAITDFVDHHEPSHEVFVRNLASATVALTDQLKRIVLLLAAGVSLEALHSGP